MWFANREPHDVLRNADHMIPPAKKIADHMIPPAKNFADHMIPPAKKVCEPHDILRGKKLGEGYHVVRTCEPINNT